MKNQTTTFHGAVSITPRRITLFIAAVGLLAAATSTGANQVYKACGKKWIRQAAKLPAEQIAWLMEQRAAELDRDLDGDGIADRVSMTSTPSFRHCKVRNNWNLKETTIRIDYGNGHSQLFHWIGTHLVERMKLYPETGKILVAGVDAQGDEASKWVGYEKGESPGPPEILARASTEPVSEDGGLKVASLQ